jgi:hypothetical protein
MTAGPLMEDVMENARILNRFVGILLVGTLCLLLPATLHADSTKGGKVPSRVLLIGNSLIASDMGLDAILPELAASARPPLKITVDRSISIGSVLEGLWSEESGGRHEKILKGKYDIVVLQATLSKTGTVIGYTADTEKKFHEFGAKFDDEIRKGGAQTILFMHWQFNEPKAMTIEDIARIYKEVSIERGIMVAPVGIAWQRAQKKQPKLVLLSDSVHPNFEGCYLSACVLYATIFKKTPVGLANHIKWSAVTPAQAKFFQSIAWEVVQEYDQPVR